MRGAIIGETWTLSVQIGEIWLSLFQECRESFPGGRTLCPRHKSFGFQLDAFQHLIRMLEQGFGPQDGTLWQLCQTVGPRQREIPHGLI